MEQISSKEEMSLLTRLPPDLLSKIVALLGGTSLVLLWRTGCPQLQHTMASRGGVLTTKMSLKGALNPSRLPEMLGSLKSLTSLTIEASGFRIGHPWRIWRCLSKLTLLQTLSLTFAEAEEWLFEELSKDSEISFSDGFSMDSKGRLLALRPIADTFPHLALLRLIASSSFLTDKDLAKLPQTLTHLNLASNTRLTNDCYKYLATLPNLAMLRIKRSSQALGADKLPPSITSLVIDLSRMTIIPKSFWNGGNISTIHVGLRPESVEHLPSETLEHIHSTIRGPVRSFSHLTRLKTLSLHLENGEMPGKVLPDLPVTLEKLTVSMKTFRAGDVFILPPAVSYLSIEINGELDAESMITALVQQAKRLKTLQMSYQSGTDPTSDAWLRLPSSLTSLVWLRLVAADVIPIIGALPPNLTSFETQFAVPISALSSLPTNLTSLRCSLLCDDMELWLSESEFMLPAGLSDVRFRHTDSTSNLPPISPSVINALNKCPLKDLAFTGWSHWHWSVESVKQFPSSLRWLSLYMRSWDPGCLEALPCGLQHLCITQRYDKSAPEAAPCLRGCDLQKLPRTLLELELTLRSSDLIAFDFVDDDLADLPPHLSYINVERAPLLTAKGLPLLPRGCNISFYGAPIQEAYKVMTDRLASNFQDPDPRVIGGDLEWP